MQKSSYLSKQSFKHKPEGSAQQPHPVLQKTMQLLEEGDKSKLETVKSHLLEACASLNVQIGMKALSMATSSKCKSESLNKEQFRN